MYLVYIFCPALETLYIPRPSWFLMFYAFINVVYFSSAEVSAEASTEDSAETSTEASAEASGTTI